MHEKINRLLEETRKANSAISESKRRPASSVQKHLRSLRSEARSISLRSDKFKKLNEADRSRMIQIKSELKALKGLKSEAKGDLKPIQDLILRMIMSGKDSDLDKLERLIDDYVDAVGIEKAPGIVKAIYAVLQGK